MIIYRVMRESQSQTLDIQTQSWQWNIYGILFNILHPLQRQSYLLWTLTFLMKFRNLQYLQINITYTYIRSLLILRTFYNHLMLQCLRNINIGTAVQFNKQSGILILTIMLFHFSETYLRSEHKHLQKATV